jgi:L-serine dehydratase
MLPGGQGQPRRAAAQAAAIAGTDPTLPAWAAVYATAVAEENAAGGRVVAAPSNGSAGPVAAVLHQWRSITPVAGDEGAVTFLLAAAAVGQLMRANGVKHIGCQGEVGVAAAMAAAGLAAVNSASNSQVLFAAERGLEPFLGMTCDPVGGLVQDPCIGRNAAAAAHAVQSARLALRVPDPPRVAFDMVLRSMVETGRGMANRYQASSLGGLAVNVIDC